MSQPASYVFLDTETTGLPWQENNCTRVTELAMVAVHRDHMKTPDRTTPRLLQKLVMCFSPDLRIPPIVTKVTGLDNKMLDYAKPFTKNSARLIRGFLDALASPVCFVAHNGNKFDYPILRAELENVQETFGTDVLCIDSLEMFRSSSKSQIIHPQVSTDSFLQDDSFSKDELEMIATIERQYSNDDEILAPFVPSDNVPIIIEKVQPERNVSYKLGDIYKRLYGKQMEGLHHAEADCTALLLCCKAKVDEFIEWSDKHSIAFNSIGKMEPGKKFPPPMPTQSKIL